MLICLIYIGIIVLLHIFGKVKGAGSSQTPQPGADLWAEHLALWSSALSHQVSKSRRQDINATLGGADSGRPLCARARTRSEECQMAPHKTSIISLILTTCTKTWFLPNQPYFKLSLVQDSHLFHRCFISSLLIIAFLTRMVETQGFVEIQSP